MATATTTIWQVQAGGSDTQCGGGFDASLGGTDYSQQNTAQATGTVTVVGTTCTATSGIFTSAMVGNIITDGGSYREITAFTSSTIVTIDSTVSWTARTIYVGGAFASPGKAGLIVSRSGQQIAVKYSATPYTISTSSTGTSGGCLSLGPGITIFGYNTTRTPYNTDALQPTLQVGSGVFSAIIFQNNSYTVSNLILDGNSQSGSSGSLADSTIHIGCTFKNFPGGAVSSAVSICINCLFTGNAGFPYVCTNIAYGCVGTTNTVSVFNGLFNSDCIAYGNTGASTDGFNLSSSGSSCVNCVSVSNGRDGFRNSAAVTYSNMTNCIAQANSAYGFNQTQTNSVIALINCGSYNNTSGRSTTSGPAVIDQNPLTGSGSFFVNAASGDFLLNATAGAGAILRAVGYPTVFPGGLTNNYRDIGAAQHQDPAGASGLLFMPGMSGGMES